MDGNTKIQELVAEVLDKQPNFDESFVAQGGDSFRAIVLMERLAEEVQVNVELEQLLSTASLRSVLSLT